MAAPPTYQELFNLGKAEALSRRVGLAFDEGDISEFDLAAASAMGDFVVGWAADRIKATYFDGAKGDDLTVLADDHVTIQRNPPVQATGTVRLQRTSANGAPAGTIIAGSVFSTAKDAQGRQLQYAIDTDQMFSAGELSRGGVTATAIVAGPEANVGLPNPLLGSGVVQVTSALFDASFSVANDSAFVGGTDEETDDDLLERVRAYPQTLRRSTVAALAYGALQVASVKRATVVETDGIVSLYVTDIAGGSSPQMVADVKAEIESWRAAGVIVNVFGGGVLTQAISVKLELRAGVVTPDVIAKVQAAIIATVNQLKIGDKLDPGIIQHAAYSADPAVLVVTVLNPAVTITPLASQLIRAGAVTVT